MYNVTAGGDNVILDLTKLNSGLIDKIDINETYSFSKEQLKDTELISLDDVKISGFITKSSTDDYHVFLSIKGIMVLPCSLTLKPVEYPFNIDIDGYLKELFEEIDKNVKKIENTIDILPIIWENILVELPMKVVSNDLQDLKLEGNGWKLIIEEEKKEINPELEKLKDLL